MSSPEDRPAATQTVSPARRARLTRFGKIVRCPAEPYGEAMTSSTAHRAAGATAGTKSSVAWRAQQMKVLIGGTTINSEELSQDFQYFA